MNDLDLISEAKIEVSSTGVSETLAKVDQLAGSVEGLAVAQDGLSKAQIRVNAQLESTAKRYDAEYKALSELSKAVNLLERARSQNLAGTEAYARIQDNVTLKLQAQANAARAANEAQQKLASTIRDQAQGSINAATGVRFDFDSAARAEDIAAYGAELDRLKEKFVPLFALSQQLARAQAEVASALDVGAISANEAAEANLRLTRTYEDQTQKLARLDQTRKESAQRAVNSQLIVPDRGADIAAYGAALNALQAEFDPLFAAEQKYLTYMERLDNALSVGAVSQDVYNKRAAEAGAALDKAAAAAAGLVVEQEKIVTTTNSAAAAQEHFNSLLGVRTDFGTAGRASDIEAYGRALKDTRAAYDPVYRAQEQYRDGLQKLRADFAAGAIPLEIFNTQLAQQKAAFVEVASGLGMMTARQREYAAAAEAAARVSQVETAKSSMAADLDSYVAGLNAEKAALVPLVAIQQQYDAAEQKAASARDRGIISQQQYEAAVKRAAATQLNQTNELRKADEALTRVTKGVGLNAYGWTNLSYQVNDVVTSLASGISPMQTLAQQGGQVFQILQGGQGGVVGALKGIGLALLALNPLIYVFGALAAAIVAVTAVTYKFVSAQRDVELALLGAGRAAGVSAQQIEDIADKASRMSTITISAAREVEQAFLKGGKVYGEAFLPGTVAAENFAKASKQSVGDSAKFIGDALANIKTDGLDKLNAESQNFDAGFRKVIENLLEAGKVAEAQRLAVERFGDAFKSVGEKALATSSFLNRLDQGFNRLATSVGRGVSEAFNGAPLQKQIEDLKRARDSASATAIVQGETPDTSYYDKQIQAATKALQERTAATEKDTQATRANREASDTSATKTRVSAVADLESLKRDREILNAERNALEAQKASGIDVPPERFANNKEALSGVVRALKDYEAASGAAGIGVEKLNRVTAAQEQAIKAVTPAEKAAAAEAMAKAQTFGTVTSETEYLKKASDAYTQSMVASRQQTINQNNALDESAAGSARLSDALQKTGNSVEFLKARNEALAQARAGTISQDEVEGRTKAILTEKIEQLRQQKSEEIRSLQDEAKARNAVAGQVQAGQLSAAEAQRRADINVRIGQLQREIDAADGKQKADLTVTLGELTVATEAQISAEKRLQVASMSEESGRQIELLQKESELLGLNNRDRAIALAQLQAEQSLKRQGISITASESVEYINKEKLKADLTYAKDQYQRLSQDITSALGGIFDDMTSSGKKSLTTFFDSFSKGFSRIGSRMLEQNLIGPLINGGLDGKGGSSAPGLLDKLSGFFGGGSAEKAVAGGAEKGIFSGITSLFSGGSKDSGAGGAFAKSNLGSLLAPAAIGGSIGYQSQSPVIGAVGGALTGFATGGVLGGLVGGAAGILGGLFGESQAKKQAKKQLQQEIQARKEALEQARPQIEALSIQFEGGNVGAIGKNITDAESQAKQAIKTASDAGDRELADRLMRNFQTYVSRQVAIFSDGFGGILAEVQAGFGTNGPFSQALSSVQQLGDALKGFIADSMRLGDPAAKAAAQQAAMQAALTSLNPAPTLSETQTELARIQGTAAGLNQILKDLGLSSAQAAAAINAGVGKAIDQLRDKFNTDLGRKINTAQGKDYLNDAADLVKEVASLNADATAVGGDINQVQTYFVAAAQKIVDGSQLTGSAFQELIAQFPQLTGLVHDYSASLTDSAEAMSAAMDRAAGYQDRLFAAQHNSGSLDDQLAIFDRQADKDRAAEVKAGGQALVDLEAAQAAERVNIIADFGQKAADALSARLKGYQDRLFAASVDTSTLGGALAAYDHQANQERLDEVKAGGEGLLLLEQAQAAERTRIVQQFWQQAQEAFNQFADTVKKWLDSLTAGANTPLSPQDRLAAAQAQYNQQLAAARAGDQNALGSITTYAQSLLDASKAFYASSQAFQDTFKSVTSELGALPGQVGVGAFMKYATGGWVQGPGTGTSDSILARLSNGEFVMSAAAADRYGPILEAMNDDRPMATVAPPRAPVSSGSQSGAAMVAEIRALRAEVSALRGDVQQGTDVAEAGHLGTIAATKDVGAGIAKGNRSSSRREVAA